jgi:hypothetical protein
MTGSLHGSVIPGPGDNARLRTGIGELSVAREVFAGVPAGEHEGDFSFLGCTSRWQSGMATRWRCSGAELEGHRLASAEARGPTPPLEAAPSGLH